MQIYKSDFYRKRSKNQEWCEKIHLLRPWNSSKGSATLCHFLPLEILRGFLIRLLRFAMKKGVLDLPTGTSPNIKNRRLLCARRGNLNFSIMEKKREGIRNMCRGKWRKEISEVELRGNKSLKKKLIVEKNPMFFLFFLYFSLILT